MTLLKFKIIVISLGLFIPVFLTGINSQNSRIFAETSAPLTAEEEWKSLADNPELNDYRESRRHFSKDPLRPIYHFVNPKGNLNDPNGLCFWQGKWHLFYQAFPEGDPGLHWGHAVSDDLVHWKDLPLAIHPDPESNCFSGSIWLEENRAIACYHGVDAGTMIAISSDPLLLNWEKITGKAVIPMPQGDVPYHIYDPCLWKEGDSYYILTSHFQKVGETKVIRPAWFLFESSDLIHWNYVHQFVDNDYFSQVFGDGACPYFWPIGDQSDMNKRRHLLLHSCHTYGSAWLLGVYDREKKKFFPNSGEYWNRGAVTPCGVHAPSAFPDGKGNIVVINNMNEGQETPGWNQIMTLPFVLSLLPKDELAIVPVQALDSLHFNPIQKENVILPANEEIVFGDIKGKSMEFRLKIEPGSSSAIQMKFFRSGDQSEYTTVTWYPSRGVRHRSPGVMPRLMYGEPESVLEIDAKHSSLASVRIRPVEQAGVASDPNEPLELRVFIDRSVIEVFAGGRQYIAERVYPSLTDSDGFSVESRGADAVLKSLETWQMKNIYVDSPE